MTGRIPASAVLTEEKAGHIYDPGGPNHGKPARIKWWTYGIPSGVTYYVEAYVDHERLFRRSATGRNVAKWRAAYDDMAEVIR